MYLQVSPLASDSALSFLQKAKKDSCSETITQADEPDAPIVSDSEAPNVMPAPLSMLTGGMI